MLDNLNAIERLHKLLVSGAITDAEFEAEKAKILTSGSDVNEVAASNFHSLDNDETPSFLRSKKFPLIVLILGLAAILSYVGFAYSSKGKTDIPFSLPATESPAEPTDSQADSIKEGSVETAPEPESTIQYDFSIEKYTRSEVFGPKSVYLLKNKSTEQIMLSSVKINNREDCIAYTREQEIYDKSLRTHLSQFEDDGEIITGSNFDVGKTVEIQYDFRKCGEIIFADINMMDGTTIQLRSL